MVVVIWRDFGPGFRLSFWIIVISWIRDWCWTFIWWSFSLGSSLHRPHIPCSIIWWYTNSKLVTNSSDNFTNLFHEFFPQIFLSLRSWKRKQTSHWFKISVFSQFASWKRYYNKYSLKNFVDSEFEIGESIWWTTPKLVMSFHLWKMGSGPCLITIPFKLAPMITSESLSSLKAS